MVLDKKALRQHLIKARLDMDETTYHRLSCLIMDKLKQTDDFISAKTVGIYLSYNHEVDTWQFAREVIDTKRICVPVIDDNNEMHFVQLDCFDHLKKNKYGIFEPVTGKTIKKKDIDLIIVPVVGYNNDYYRLGYGGGYYDRYLQDYHGKTIGIAFQMQKISHYIPESHDIPLNKMIIE